MGPLDLGAYEPPNAQPQKSNTEMARKSNLALFVKRNEDQLESALAPLHAATTASMLGRGSEKRRPPSHAAKAAKLPAPSPKTRPKVSRLLAVEDQQIQARQIFNAVIREVGPYHIPLDYT